MSAKPLSKKQLGRLRRACIQLAMECVEGTAPFIGIGFFGSMSHPVCALGHVRARAKVKDIGDIYLEHCDLVAIVEEANDESIGMEDRRAALPFPLLALADALVEAP